MATVLLVCVVILVVAALVFGIVSLLTGEDPGLAPVEPDGRALPLPNHRSLTESDLKAVRFDVTLRGYRMAQVDRALRRTAYDVGYKDEMIAVLEAEVAALREGRLEDADLLRKAREAAAKPEPVGTPSGRGTDESDEASVIDLDLDAQVDDADDADDAEDEIAEADAEVDVSPGTPDASADQGDADDADETPTGTDEPTEKAESTAVPAPAVRSAPKKTAKRPARA